jgi:hypothetical protein
MPPDSFLLLANGPFWATDGPTRTLTGAKPPSRFYPKVFSCRGGFPLTIFADDTYGTLRQAKERQIRVGQARCMNL